jgi:hypothetical protein
VSHEACGHCGNVHTSGDPYALIEEYRNQFAAAPNLTPAAVHDIFALARCLHSQLCEAVADLHNLRLGFGRTDGSVEESGTRFAVRRRDGKIIESPAPDLAVSRFDNMNAQAVELGFESAEAEVVRRKWALYVEDWTAVPPTDIEQYRLDDEPPF